MPQTVFHIQKLICSYVLDAAHAVLCIDDLEIHKGEIVFLLGSSGSGKSTLLENLGLMNNTIASGDILFYPDSGTPVSFASLWQPNQQAKSAEVRKSNFSFIFQNTNLMENFTAYENVSLSKMIQQDTDQQSAMAGAQVLMDRVGLPQDQVSTTSLSVNLSGGQRQRVAFVRALNSDCTVLFGDEPTGNLDEGNANELMNIVRTYLQEKGLTAIIVSHDINLAINHASRIICLTKNPVKGHGEILPENIYESSSWKTKNADEINVFKQKIRTYYTQQAPPKVNKPAPTAPLTMSSGYMSLFLKKEGKALAGRAWSNMLILILLLVFTFLAIGFANGSLRYLKEKIENPFVLWLTIDIPASKDTKGEVDDIKHKLSEPDIMKRYAIKAVSSYTEKPLVFYTSDLGTIAPTPARSVHMTGTKSDPVIEDLFNKENQIKHGTKAFQGTHDLSIIVTERFMKENKYDLNAPFVYFYDHEYVKDTINRNTDNEKITEKKLEFPVPLAVRAVVKEMPGKSQVAYTDFFDHAYMQIHKNTFDLRLKNDFLVFLATKDRDKAREIQKSILASLRKSAWAKGRRFEAELPELSTDCYHDGFKILITPTPPVKYDEWGKLYREAVAPAIPSQVISGYYFDYYTFDHDFAAGESSDKLSINLSNLDSVRSFAYYFLTTFNDADEKQKSGAMEVDTAKVKEKENFNFLSYITMVISYILILFGTVSVTLFIYNLLKMHLEKVKMNIGTFKAFGLSDAQALRVYFLIVLRFVVISLIVSLALAAGLGALLNYLFVHYGKNIGADYFAIFGFFTYLTFGLIFVSALTVSWFTIRSMLSRSPGDLIYNR